MELSKPSTPNGYTTGEEKPTNGDSASGEQSTPSMVAMAEPKKPGIVRQVSDKIGTMKRDAREYLATEWHSFLVMACVNAANMCCHTSFSLMDSFFPQKAAEKVSKEQVGLIFAAFPAAVIVSSPIVGRSMSKYGTITLYTAGLLSLSLATFAFAGADKLSAAVFFPGCIVLRMLQGVGSAMEEVSAYALIASVAKSNLSLFLGITELSTGLGYMIGPPLGGMLYTMGGFRTPFLTISVALLIASVVVSAALLGKRFKAVIRRILSRARLLDEDAAAEAIDPADDGADGEGEGGEEEAPVPVKELLAQKQVALMAACCVIANSDFAFLEPTLGVHALEAGLAEDEAGVGLLFATCSLAYTLSCPLAGVIANTKRLGARKTILLGLGTQAVGFFLLGGNAASLLGAPIRLQWLMFRLGLLCLGMGEAFAMTPVMQDMLTGLGLDPDAAGDGPVVHALGGLLACSFALGQVVGPILGTALTNRMAFTSAATVAGFLQTGMLAVAISLSLSPNTVSRPGGYKAPVPKVGAKPSDTEERTEVAGKVNGPALGVAELAEPSDAGAPEPDKPQVQQQVV